MLHARVVFFKYVIFLGTGIDKIGVLSALHPEVNHSVVVPGPRMSLFNPGFRYYEGGEIFVFLGDPLDPILIHHHL